MSSVQYMTLYQVYYVGKVCFFSQTSSKCNCQRNYQHFSLNERYTNIMRYYTRVDRKLYFLFNSPSEIVMVYFHSIKYKQQQNINLHSVYLHKLRDHTHRYIDKKYERTKINMQKQSWYKFFVKLPSHSYLLTAWNAIGMYGQQQRSSISVCL